MSNGYTMSHMEWLAYWGYSNSIVRPDQFHVLLYDDEVDELTAQSDIEDITSEPESGNYERATLAFPADTKITVNEHYVQIDPVTAVFDFAGVTETVSHAGVVWEAELQGDEERRDHLMVRNELDERMDLTRIRGRYEVEVPWQLHPLF